MEIKKGETNKRERDRKRERERERDGKYGGKYGTHDNVALHKLNQHDDV
jgi:hypothetical protein